MSDMIVKALKTVGLSPKAVLAFVFPIIAATSASVVSWIATGTFNAQEIKLAVAGVVAGGVAALGAYVGAPGKVQARVPNKKPPTW